MNASTAAGDATANVAADVDPRSFKTFAECRPFDLGEHRNRTCRRLHYVGSTLVLACLAPLVATGRLRYILLALRCGDGFARIGHFVLANNRPVTLERPLHSLNGDRAMYRDIRRGRTPF